MTEHPYLRRAYAAAAARDPNQTVFLQALEQLYEGMEPCPEEGPAWMAAGLAERLGEPERAVQFPVTWTDDQGLPRVTRGFFVRHTAIHGPCRCALLFRPELDLAEIKAQALATSLTAALAGLPWDGGVAGADAAPGEMTDSESRRFCQAFIAGLLPHLGRDFSPAQWSGMAARRELDFLTGQYERLAIIAERTPAAQAAQWPLSRSQAQGYGLCRFAQFALRRLTGQRLEGQSVLISGTGALAAWSGEMAVRLGAKAAALGDMTGCLSCPAGLPLRLLQDMAGEPGLPLLLWAIRTPGVEYRPGPALWDIPADVVFLCDGVRLGSAGARRIAAHRPTAVFEGMPLAATVPAGRILGRCGLYSPGIVSGAGGDIMARVAAERRPDRWEAERQLRAAMETVFETVHAEADRAERPGDLAMGAYAAAFRAIADAMTRKGI